MSFAERLRIALPEAVQDCPGQLSFAAWDLDEGQPVTLDSQRLVHSASTIKVLIMIAALRQVGDRVRSLDEELELPEPSARAAGFGVLRELVSVPRLSLADLITLMIVISDNAATNAVMDTVGLDEINRCARELGCSGTLVERRLMDVHGTGRNVTTAMDQARILDRLATEQALPFRLTQYALDILSRQQIQDRLPALLPGEATCWNKTGELLGLRHDVGLIGIDRPKAVVAVLVDELADDRSVVSYRGGPGSNTIAGLGLSVFRALG